MHPYVAQAISAERIADMRDDVAAYRRARRPAAYGRRRTATPQAVHSGWAIVRHARARG